MNEISDNYTVLQKTEWKNIPFDGGFKTSYQLIDSSILIIQGQGYSSLEAEKQSILFGENILDDSLPPGHGYIMIQDWREYENSSSRARQYFIDSIVKDRRVKGLIFCNTTWHQAMTIKIAKTLKILPLTLHICHSLAEAIDCGHEILVSGPAMPPRLPIWSRPFARMRLKKQTFKTHIQDLLNYLETIDWKTGKFIRQYIIDPRHPMLPVFDAISFIKSQLDKTFEDRNRIEHALVVHKNNLEKIVQQRTRALEQSEKHFKQLLEHSPISSAVIQDNYHLIFINQKFTKTFGWSLEEITTPEQIVPLIFHAPDDKVNKFTDWAETIFASKGTQFGPHEHSIICKDDSVRTAEITSTAIGGKILVLMNDITKRKHAEAKLAELAVRDDLTNLFNRRHFMNVLASEFHRSRRYTLPLCMMLVDVDYFKKVNDTHGHPAGDKVLKTLADLTRNSFREIDTLFRIGGEEFAIILPETQRADAMTAAIRFKETVQATDFTIEGTTLSITVSIGLSMLSEATTSIEAFMKKTDDALYLAKDNGRNRVDYL